jgi:YD repeat-containing protein
VRPALSVYQRFDAMNRKTQYGYDADGRQTLVIHPDSTTSVPVVDRTIYDDNGNPVIHVDPGGHVTQTVYDGLNRPTEVDVLKSSDYLLSGTITVLSSRTTKYDNDGSVLSETDENGNTTAFTYDDAGNKLTETEAPTGTATVGNTTTFGYECVQTSHDRLTGASPVSVRSQPPSS